jgi:hypothetical protein
MSAFQLGAQPGIDALAAGEQKGFGKIVVF